MHIHTHQTPPYTENPGYRPDRHNSCTATKCVAHCWPVCFHLSNVTNQTFLMKHRPVAPGWRVSRTSVYMLQLAWTCAELYVNLLVLMHTCKSLLNTLGRAIEQLVGCLAKQCKSQQSRSEYNSHATPIGPPIEATHNQTTLVWVQRPNCARPHPFVSP